MADRERPIGVSIGGDMSEVSGKWGVNVAARGFAQIPNYLLFLNQFLEGDKRLTPIEMGALIQLVGTWWRKDTLPFPSVATLATRIGASPRQVQRALSNLESRGYLKREARRSRGIAASNAYDLSPLVEVLGEIATAFPNAFPRNVRSAPVRPE